jgi:hypothetical protein
MSSRSGGGLALLGESTWWDVERNADFSNLAEMKESLLE